MDRICILVEEDIKKKAMKRASFDGTTVSILMRKWLRAYIQIESPEVRLERLREELKVLAKEMDKKQ